MAILVTGGAGFIGSHFVRARLARGDGEVVVNLDALMVGGHEATLADLQTSPQHRFVHGDVCDRALVASLLSQHTPRAVVHFAAHTHVDRSIADAGAFVRSNVQGTFELLEAVRLHWRTLAPSERAAFRFLHVSTDEVYGSLDPDAPPFDEASPVQPTNPYAATKAASDHLVHAWHRTHGLPVLLTHCGNNHGPFQWPEKLIPHLIACARAGQPLPVYGDGRQVRDWIDVRDHVSALEAVLTRAPVGSNHLIGAGDERHNLDVVQAICAQLDTACPRADGQPHACAIVHVDDRPGHDRRYALDAGRLRRDLGWMPRHRFDDAIGDTVRWYLDHPEWLQAVQPTSRTEGRT